MVDRLVHLVNGTSLRGGNSPLGSRGGSPFRESSLVSKVLHDRLFHLLNGIEGGGHQETTGSSTGNSAHERPVQNLKRHLPS